MANRGGVTPTGTAAESGSWLRTFIYVTGSLLVGGMIWLLIADRYTAANINAKCFDLDTVCCSHWDSGREHAERIGASFAHDWSIMLFQTNHAKHEFAEKFSHHGIYSTAYANYQGRSNIQAALQQYVDTTSDTRVRIHIHRFYWDSERYTLTIEWTWWADTAGGPYSQDQAIEIRFDCEFKVVFYRGYWDSSQQNSTYTRRHAPACDQCRHNRERPPHDRDDERDGERQDGGDGGDGPPRGDGGDGGDSHPHSVTPDNIVVNNNKATPGGSLNAPKPLSRTNQVIGARATVSRQQQQHQQRQPQAPRKTMSSARTNVAAEETDTTSDETNRR